MKVLQHAAAPATRGQTRSSQSPAGERHNLVVALAWFAVVFAILVAFWFFRIRPIYVEEQFSEISTSAWMYHPHYLGWFVRPFSLYTLNYPEWSLRYRAFIRPVEALHYFLCSVVFHYNFRAYLLFNYFYEAATCGLTFYVASELLGLSQLISNCLAFLVFVSPAQGQQQSFLISFAADPLAGFLIMASVVFFLRRRYLPAWFLIVFAVGAKETTWPIALFMAFSFILFRSASLRCRILLFAAFLAPLVTIIVLRMIAFGPGGALTSDLDGSAVETFTGIGIQGAAQHGIKVLATKLLFGLSRWPFGVLLQSQQYDPRLLHFWRDAGWIINFAFWTILAAWLLRAVLSRLNSPGIKDRIHRIRSSGSRFPFVALQLAFLAAGSLIFPLRFGVDPRYGSPTYPLIFLSLGILLTVTSRRSPRAAALVFLIFVGLYGSSLRISDATRGTDTFRKEWQLVHSYRNDIAAAGPHLLFIVDDLTGGEINSEAIQKFYGPQAKVVRVNDVSKEGDCRIFESTNGDLPLHITVIARRIAPESVLVRSVITGCGGHRFLGVPTLPPGDLVRHSFGTQLTYALNPRSSPQFASDQPRVLEVTIDHFPADATIVAPDLKTRTYPTVPIT